MECSSVTDNGVKEVKHFADPEKQEARAFLRERFLRAISGIVGKKCDFHMFENTKVSAEFGGCDADVLNFFVTNLQTPVSVKSTALLRTGDILTVHVPDIEKLPK